MYYGGIDLGTSSIGWSLTDENYNLIRKKGKDLWGVRLFDEAKSAEERRVNRVTRRRRAREVARIGMLKEYFAEAICNVDPGFYQRMEESKYHWDDKKIGEKYAIFADSDYTDKDYYAQYPTIFHLRKELIESDEIHDIRLVYLAVLNLFKRRGHFLNEYLENAEKEESISELYNKFCEVLPEELELSFTKVEEAKEMEQILGNKELARNEKAERLAQHIGIVKSQKKGEYELIKMLCGLAGKLSLIFGKEVLGEEYSKKQLSFRDATYEETINTLCEVLPEEYIELLEAAKAIHDKGLLVHILKGHTYLSQARVESYEKHAQDLLLLRASIKKYCIEEYDGYFREMSDANYSGYIGSVNSGKAKMRRNRNAKQNAYKAFWNETKRILDKMPDDDADVAYLKRELEKEALLPKQLTFENGVIPNQIHLAELKKILSNAEQYHAFLKEKDTSGLSVSERIIQLFKFQIPYYVGPLHVNAGEEDKKWVKRKEGGEGKVLPWNLEEKVDIKETRERFITRMVRRCTYMAGENVLPKNSLLYEKFMVLNELNNVRISGAKLPVALKQDIFNDLFLSGKKVTMKRFMNYLVGNGIIGIDQQEAITGIDGGFQQSMVSYSRFYSVLGDGIKNWETQKIAEKIIFWGTVYSNDKKVMRELITEKYGSYFNEEQIKRILGFKWKDWGRLSKSFFEIEGCSKEDGVVTGLLNAMWETDCNLMELLSDRFTYADALKEKAKKQEKLLAEFSYEDLEDSYLSAPVKRMTWQTILIIKELCQVMGEQPTRLFVEMPRTDGEKGRRTVSRKKRLEELYKTCKEDGKKWLKEIEGLSEDRFRSKKLYLYYAQMGRCMYTGNPIQIEDLLSANSKYDIDHIYPRHYIKDDSIENNLVLVEKESNGHKSDTFPLEKDVRDRCSAFWKYLRSVGFISEEKYKRLTRTWEFNENELASFINRQIVETGQATKYVAELLGMLLPETEIVYVKAGNVSDFRHKTELFKSRSVNDYHHAQDAYLNIVVGNTYHTKFTKNPLRFVQDYQKDKKANAYHMDKIFQYDVVRNDVTAWRAGEKGTIVTVKKVIAKNTPLLTKRTYEAHGGIAEQTIYSAKEANYQSYISVKASDSRISDVQKYGGFSSVSGTYYFLVEHKRKGKWVRTIEQMPLYLKGELGDDEEALKKYCVSKLGLARPVIRLKKIPMRSLVKRNGYLLNLAGRTGNQIMVENAMPLSLNRKWINYVKRMENFVSAKMEEDSLSDEKRRITSENNAKLYQELIYKHTESIYKRKPNPLGEKLVAKQGDFEAQPVKEQVAILLELLKNTQTKSLGINIKSIDLKASASKIGNEVTSQEEFLLINQSVTGIYTSVIDLKTV